MGVCEKCSLCNLVTWNPAHEQRCQEHGVHSKDPVFELQSLLMEETEEKPTLSQYTILSI